MADKTNTIQELNLADSFLFGKVMSDTEICRMVLEKILNVPIKKVEFPITRKTTEIFLCTKGKKDDVDDGIKDFLSYIENSTDACAQQTSSPLVRAIHKRVTEIKLDKIWNYSI